MTTTATKAPEKPAARREPLQVPDADVYETAKAVHLTLDLAGVNPPELEAHAEADILRISGRAVADAPEGYTLTGREFRPGRYIREFQLSPHLDAEKATATFRHGLLEVTIPKKEAAKKLEINIKT